MAIEKVNNWLGQYQLNMAVRVEQRVPTCFLACGRRLKEKKHFLYDESRVFFDQTSIDTLQLLEV